MANIFKRLMERLGHKKFYVMGGDWGALITSDISTIYPDRYFMHKLSRKFSYSKNYLVTIIIIVISFFNFANKDTWGSCYHVPCSNGNGTF